MNQPIQQPTKTQLQSSEIQDWIIRGRTDPIFFAHKLLGMELHEGQQKYIQERTAHGQKINILTCANRWGKSVTIAILQIHHLFYKIGIDPSDAEAHYRAEYRTANIAPHSAMTEPVFKTIHQIMTSSFSINSKDGMKTNDCIIGWFYLPDKTLNTPPYKQVFANNSYIEHRSLGGDMGDSLQGKPYGFISYDEGGRSDHLEHEINDAILARLFDWNAKLDIISTPSSESKSSLYYYELYMDGLAGFNARYTMSGSLRDNTFFSPEQIQAQYDMLANNPLRDQMLEGKFIFGGGALFDMKSILDCKDNSLNDGVRREPGHTYMIGIDTAIGNDEMVYTVLDVTNKPYRQVRKIHARGNTKSPQLWLYDLLDLFDSYGGTDTVQITLETWNGESVRFYHDLPDHVKGVTHCFGAWQPAARKNIGDNPMKPTPNASKKSDLLMTLRKLLDERGFKFPGTDSMLANQLSYYREDDKKLKTDHVFSLAMAVYGAEELNAPMELAFESVEW